MHVEKQTNWNELSIDVKKVQNVKSFKKKLYTNLIAKQKETGNFEYLLNTSFKLVSNIKYIK